MLMTRLRTVAVRRAAGIALLAGLSVLSTATNAWSHPFFIDQANDVLSFSGGFTGNSQTGQSFVPTFTALDVVELLINDQSPGDTFGISMFVRIRAGSMLGPILGSSLVVSMADFAPAPFITPVLTHFDFPAIVPLTPGGTYVIEVVNTSFPGDIGVFATGFNTDAYAAGEAYFLGLPASISAPALSPVDLWFREGVAAVPEPTTMLMLGTGLAGLFMRRRRRR